MCTILVLPMNIVLSFNHTRRPQFDILTVTTPHQTRPRTSRANETLVRLHPNFSSVMLAVQICSCIPVLFFHNTFIVPVCYEQCHALTPMGDM